MLRRVTTALTTCLMVGFLITPATLLPFSAAASGLDDTISGLGVTANQAGLSKSATPESKAESQKQLNQLVGTIVQTLLGLTGVVFMIIIVAAGDLWLTSGGNEEKITKARGMIFNGVVGIALVFAAYLSADFIVSVALRAGGISP